MAPGSDDSPGAKPAGGGTRLPGHAERVLVTGASGFIGRHLVARLVAAGSEVHAIARGPQPARPGVRWWQADLTDIDGLRAVVRGARPDAFVHLASMVSGARDVTAVLPTFRNNLESTVNALVCLAEAGCARCVLAGSMEEPDLARGQFEAGSPYAAAKHASAVYGRMFFDLYQLPVVTLRLYMVYGPGQGDTAKLVPYTITSLLAGAAPRFSSGVRPVDWIFVDDVVDGLAAAVADRGPAGYGADIGSGELVTVRDVVTEIARQMGREEPSPSARSRTGRSSRCGGRTCGRRRSGWDGRRRCRCRGAAPHHRLLRRPAPALRASRRPAGGIGGQQAVAARGSAASATQREVAGRRARRCRAASGAPSDRFSTQSSAICRRLGVGAAADRAVEAAPAELRLALRRAGSGRSRSRSSTSKIASRRRRASRRAPRGGRSRGRRRRCGTRGTGRRACA